MKVTVKDVRAAIANLPDEAEVVLWIKDEDGEVQATDAGKVAAFGPHGADFLEAPNSLHIWEDGIANLAGRQPGMAIVDDLAPKRWDVVVRYRSVAGVVDAPHEIEELADLQDMVEHGPDWNTIEDITIRLAAPDPAGLTIEEAERR